MKAPFTYFGGKSKVADEVWRRFGKLQNYIEPFAGSAAVLLKRPRRSVWSAKHDHDWGIETINDADGLVSNFWRSMRHHPEELIHHANWPVNEADLHARHLWLVKNMDNLTDRLMGDPEWCDPKAAGWWLWGISIWIGGGFCSGSGPWGSVNGRLTLQELKSGMGINRQIPHLGSAGMGINRQIPHLGSAGMGINRQIPHLGNGTFVGEQKIRYHLKPLINRLRLVRVACGDWTRVLGAAIPLGVTGVFLDPPYSEGTIDYNAGDRSTSGQVRQWCKDNAERPELKIALCGYDTEHQELEQHGWHAFSWKAAGGYGAGRGGEGEVNSHRETIWFSPGCDNEKIQKTLF